MKKIIAIAALTAGLTAAACVFGEFSSFDWPQKETAADSFYSYFGQLRGGTISTSLIFNDISDIKSVQKGKILLTMREHSNDFGRFESTLGNALLISHEDSLMGIYGNLDEDTLEKNLPDTIESGTYLGKSGNSGWQDGLSCLEFQVLDIKNSSAVNPRIPMPRTGTELPLYATNITIQDEKGIYHNPLTEKRLPSGTYSIYKDRQKTAVPAKTTVSVNGAAVEHIQFETLNEINGKLCTSGDKSYSVEELYPDDKKELLARIPLTPGKNSIGITISNILKESKSYYFTLDIY
ncbi:M23 family metallopeptidase [Treponema sp.]|uniref:M23 family metallopeptidase n=1 Tax=Treponema sp. TaxID=166 RepID=UPI0025DFD672|nr:M23 family metallopeptidase [Treponema sp.]MCR5219312.1 M23 family metallopeptidase [Treponema sp.]